MAAPAIETPEHASGDPRAHEAGGSAAAVRGPAAQWPGLLVLVTKTIHSGKEVGWHVVNIGNGQRTCASPQRAAGQLHHPSPTCGTANRFTPLPVPGTLTGYRIAAVHFLTQALCSCAQQDSPTAHKPHRALCPPPFTILRLSSTFSYSTPPPPPPRPHLLLELPRPRTPPPSPPASCPHPPAPPPRALPAPPGTRCPAWLPTPP